jgi:hypothetical protein
MAQGIRYEPNARDRELVLLLAAGGVQQDLIAAAAKIAPKTMRKYYAPELESGQRQVTAQAISTLVKAMKDGGRGAVAAACFWLKCRERWTERTDLQVTGSQGGPVSITYDSPAAEIASRIASLASRIGSPEHPV